MLLYRKLALIVMFVFFSVNLFSQNFVILDIQVSGNQRIDRDLIVSTSGLRIGDTFSVDNMSQAIRTLYQLHVFEDVNITIEEINRGLRLNIIVEELPVVASFRYDGTRAISRSRLEEIGVLRIGTYWSPIMQMENTRRILAEYRSKGHNLATVEYRVREVSGGLDIRVQVSEGRRIVVRNINIHGNEEIETRRILRKMSTKRRGFLRSGRFDEEKYQEDLRSIVELYNSQGFLDARVVRVEEDIVDGRFKTLNIFLEEGERYFFRSVDVRGNEYFESTDILSRFTMRENDIFNMEIFNRQLSRVASMYYEEGFIYLNLDPQINKDGNMVDVNLVIRENTRAKIHKIHITGNRRTREKVIRRQLVVAPGDYFRQSRVVRSQQNVFNLGLFTHDMGLDYQPINANGDVDLILSVEDGTSGSANGGVGFNSRDGMVGQLSVQHNNLFGNYWQGNVSYEFSRRSQNIELGFTNPYFLDTNVLLGFNLHHTQREWVDFNYRIFSNGGGIRLGYPITAIDHARFVIGYSLFSSRYEIRNPDRPASANLVRLDSLGWQYTSAVHTTLTRDSRDNIFFPTSGSRIMLYTEVAGGPFGGDFNYFKQIAEVSWFTPAFWTTVLRTRWRMGYVTAFGSSDNEVPPNERFYLGGTGPDGIRGYADRSIGPDDGGFRSILFSTELGIPIASDQLIGLLFLDSGNSYNSFTDFNFRDFRKGAGAGMRIRTPFGLLGFDYAHNFENRRWEPHFQFGTTF